MLALETGKFSSPVHIATTNPGGLLAARDFTGDGKIDVLTGSSFNSTLGFVAGKGDGSFSAPTDFRVNNGRLVFEDLNLDGTLNLVSVVDGSQYASVLLNQSACPRPGAATAVSAASYVPFQAAPDSIAAVFGSNLASSIQVATTLPLPTSLGALSVSLRDSSAQERLAPLFFGSPGQVNLLVPTGTGAGTALLSVKNGSASVAAGTVRIGAGAQGTLAGLDQVNVRIPRTLAGRGFVDVVLTANGRSSNPIRIGIK